MIEIWTRTRMRPPTAQELRGLIDAHVLEEVLYREALALGLDRDDTIVRRRLAQKMDFVFEGLAGVPEPTDEELQALLDAEPRRFRTGGSTSFRHVFINVEERREDAHSDAVELLERLRADGPDLQESMSLGDPVLLEHEYRDLPVDQLARQFGRSFAAAFESLGPGTWSGPVESAYGLHLVHVLDFEPPRVPALEEIRDAVREEWLARRRRDHGSALPGGRLDGGAARDPRASRGDGARPLSPATSILWPPPPGASPMPPPIGGGSPELVRTR